MTRWVKAIAVLAFLVALSGGSTRGVAADEVIRISSGPSSQEIDPPGTCDGLTATITGAGKITGTSGNDVIVGSDGPDVIKGNGGNDVICGGDGDDTIYGGSGNDRLFGRGGDDTLFGDAGDDFLNPGSFVTAFQSVQVAHGGTGNDTFSSVEASWLECAIVSAQRVKCRAGAEFYGDAGNDRLDVDSNGEITIAAFHGGSGNDVAIGTGMLSGDAGDDTIIGETAVIGLLSGGSGNDTINAGIESDDVFLIDGGSGRDTCGEATIVRNCER